MTSKDFLIEKGTEKRYRPKHLETDQFSLLYMTRFNNDRVDGIGSTHLLPHSILGAPRELSIKTALDFAEGLISGLDEHDPLMTSPLDMPEQPRDVSNTSFTDEVYHHISPSPLTEEISRKRCFEEMEDLPRFRDFQAEQWSDRFHELCEYKRSNGNCLVPHRYDENPVLARWVKRQRYQYKLWQEGSHSTMTVDRARALEEIGFAWDSQGMAWQERLEELKYFKASYGHCNVPSHCPGYVKLATWVKCQRRQYKLLQEGKPSNMTPQRIAQLEKVGFAWEVRGCKITTSW